MHQHGAVAPAGDLTMRVSRGPASRAAFPTLWPAPDLHAVAQFGVPRRGLSDEINEWRTANMRNLWRGAKRVAAARVFKLQHAYGALWITVLRGSGERVDLGLASMRVVTTAGVNAIVDAFQNTVELENFKYHGFGTGTTAEATGDTALVTELTTEYVTNSTRPTGTQGEGAANVYRTVGTLSPDSGGVLAITEHGLFSATSGTTLLDRSKFAAVNLDSAAGDSLQVTYDFTVTAGS